MLAPVIAVVALALGEGGGSIAPTPPTSGLAAQCPLPVATRVAGSFPHTVHIGSSAPIPPSGMAASEKQRHVFVRAVASSDACLSTVVMLDARTGALLSAVHVGAGSGLERISDTFNRLLVANQGNEFGGKTSNSQGSVTIIDTRSGRLVATTPLGGIPDKILINDRAGTALLPTHPASGGIYSDTYLAIVNTTSGKLMARVPLAVSTFNLDVDQKTGRFVASTRKGVELLDGTTGRPVMSFSAGQCNDGAVIVDQSSQRATMFNTKSGPCLVDLARGRVLQANRQSSCGGIDRDDPADHRIFFYSGTGSSNPRGASPSAEFCVFDTGTGKVILDESPPANSVDLLAVDSPDGIVIDEESDFSSTTTYARSIRTGKVIRDISKSFTYNATDSDILTDNKTGRLFVNKGGKIAVYDPKVWKATGMLTAPAADSILLVPGTRRIFAAAGKNPGQGTVTVLCADSPCR